MDSFAAAGAMIVGVEDGQTVAEAETVLDAEGKVREEGEVGVRELSSGQIATVTELTTTKIKYMYSKKQYFN